MATRPQSLNIENPCRNERAWSPEHTPRHFLGPRTTSPNEDLFALRCLCMGSEMIWETCSFRILSNNFNKQNKQRQFSPNFSALSSNIYIFFICFVVYFGFYAFAQRSPGPKHMNMVFSFGCCFCFFPIKFIFGCLRGHDKHISPRRVPHD